MHEWALAEGIVKTAEKYGEVNSIDEITEVKVMVGELQSIEHEIIEFALDQLRTPRMKDAKFVIEAIPAKFRCRKCSREFGLEKEKLDATTGEAIHFVPEMAHVYLKCPGCGSPDFEVAEGRGVWLASIKGRKKE